MCAALTDEADGRLFISGRITVHGRNGTGILIEDKAYQIRRCRGLEYGNFGTMGFYQIFDERGNHLTGPARFRYVRRAAEWLVSRLKWDSQQKRMKVRI